MSVRARFIPLMVAALTASLLAGCQSARESRIKEHATVWAELDPYNQRMIKEGLIDYGYSAAMVYMAIGKPDSSEIVDTLQGKVEIWTYKNFVFSGGVAMKLGVNNPGQRYTGGRMVSPNAPGGASIASTATSPIAPTVGNMADAPTGTLVLDILNDKLVAIHARE